MKNIQKLIYTCGLFAAVTVHAMTPVLFPIDSMFGGAAYGKTITISAANTLLTDGVSIYAGTFQNIPSTGTNPIVMLQPNSYLLTIAGVVKAIRFNVPDSTNVQNVVDHLNSGPLFILGTNGMASLIAGSNIQFTTNADGVVAISTASNVLTNGQVGAVLDAGNFTNFPAMSKLTSPFYISDVTVSVAPSSGVLDLTGFTTGVKAVSFMDAVGNPFVTTSVTNGLASTNYVNSATNGFVKSSVTNGLVTASVTNGLVTATVTNGLAPITYVNSTTSSIPGGVITGNLTNNIYGRFQGVFAQQLLHWRAARAAANLGQGRALAFFTGDSVTYGLNGSRATLNGWTDCVNGSYVRDLETFDPIITADASIGSHSANTGDYAATPPNLIDATQFYPTNWLFYSNADVQTIGGNIGYAQAGTTNGVVFSPHHPNNFVCVILLNKAPANAAVWSDGTNLLGQLPETAAGTYTNFTFTNTSFGIHTYTIVPAATNANPYYLVGNYAANTTNSLIMLNTGVGGIDASFCITANFTNAFLSLKPAINFICLGINDARLNHTLTTYSNQLAQIGMNSLSNGIDVVYIVPNPVVIVPLSNYVSTIYAVAKSLGCPVIDFSYHMGSFATSVAAGLQTDDYHPNWRGYFDMSQCLWMSGTLLPPPMPTQFPGMVTQAQLATATNGLVTASVTNGLVSASVTNGLASTTYVTASTNGLIQVPAAVTSTNGLPLSNVQTYDMAGYGVWDFPAQQAVNAISPVSSLVNLVGQYWGPATNAGMFQMLSVPGRVLMGHTNLILDVTFCSTNADPTTIQDTWWYVGHIPSFPGGVYTDVGSQNSQHARYFWPSSGTNIVRLRMTNNIPLSVINNTNAVYNSILLQTGTNTCTIFPLYIRLYYDLLTTNWLNH